MPIIPPEIIDEIERLSRSCEGVAKEAQDDPSAVGRARMAESGNILAILKILRAVGHLSDMKKNREVVAKQRKRIDKLVSDRQATGKSGTILRQMKRGKGWR